ncbi:MAG: hypothetical protein WCX31_14230 [Salinivirgaceae bacterium]|jgi:hypothetical protein
MKRAISIVLLLVFVFNTGGFIVLFKIQQVQIRKEIKRQIKENLDSQELAIIRVTTENQNQLHWEHAKEFQYGGIMYDVVKKVVIDNLTTVYYCITDTQETILFDKLDILVNKSMDAKSDGNHPLKNLLKFLSNLYSLVNNKWSFYLNGVALFTGYIEAFNEPLLDSIFPPPKMI